MSSSYVVGAPRSMTSSEPSCMRTVDGIQGTAPPSHFIDPCELRWLGSALGFGPCTSGDIGQRDPAAWLRQGPASTPHPEWVPQDERRRCEQAVPGCHRS